MQATAEIAPATLSFHTGGQVWRGPALALTLHLALAAAWLSWPGAPPLAEIAPVVELVLAPPPPPETAPPEAPAATPPRPVSAPVAPVRAAPVRAASAPARSPAPAAAVAPQAPVVASPQNIPAAAEVTAASPPMAAPVPSAAVADVPPRVADAPRPAYPRAARQRGLQGVVTLSVQVAEDGVPVAVAVKSSSGHAILDDAALAAVRNWRFVPGRRGNQPVAAAVELPVRFALDAG